jgi:radical SAM protein with 4Fe4S-binding SPASM domain
MSFLYRGGPHWGVKLHTYGLGITPMVREAIVQASLDDPYNQSYVTLSKSTTDPAVFRDMCRPLANAPNLQAEEANLRDLFNLVGRHGSRIEVRLNYRITRMNGRPHQIADILRWLADTPQFVKIRFTTDYVPSGASLEYLSWFANNVYIPPGVAQNSISKAIVDAEFWEVDRISFRDPEASNYSGNTCYNGLLFSTVAANGRLYPCQGVAVSAYDRLSYGDLTQRRFSECWKEYVELWRDSNPIEDGCPKCAASCERMINDAMAKEINRGSL